MPLRSGGVNPYVHIYDIIGLDIDGKTWNTQNGADIVQLNKHESIEFGAFPISGVENVTFAGLTEHPDGGFTAMVEMKRGSEIPEHGHQNFEETYVISGAVECGGVLIETGDYVRVDAEETHSLKAIEDTKMFVVVHKGVIIDGMPD